MKSKQNTRQTRAAAARAYEASLAGVLDALDGRGARGRVAAATALRDACRTGRVAEAAVLGSVGNVLVLANDTSRRIYFVCKDQIGFLS